ncbi:MAG: MBL fold metallo-hydrolase [Candidatus Methanolliviera hydrocarbonicum]|uniref:UPF0282 protein EF807_06805 n=1 Tax=Candidatus Methanolliviera hydrocarbonicum TaxID=2491085 RepID=A0A520KVD4_9EURY|nr:MAG: MBL fold metallo-hydrolase [Candidatus Methanolliviera hydrocarbonicum]
MSLDIFPLAYESFGVRSMATFLETKDLKVIIDPGVSLAPRRFNLPPHPIEVKREEACWKRVKEYLQRSEYVFITHYHYDHYNPLGVDLLRGKELWIKDYENKINKSQRKRSSDLIKRLGDNSNINVADGREFDIGGTQISFSNPVFHGANDRLGYVVEVFISYKKESFLFTSDVEGPSLEDQITFILEKSPKTIFIDGPMTYMLGFRYSAKSLEDSIENLKRIIDETDVKKMIMDHHLLRDINYKEKIADLYEYSEEKGVQILSAAEYIGRENDLLEARRRELWHSQENLSRKRQK